MSDRADFLAGIAASGCGDMFGIHGDFGTFDSPYPDPSPPGAFFDASDYDISDDHNSSNDEDSSSDNSSISNTQKQTKTHKRSKTQMRSKSQKKSKSRKKSKSSKERKLKKNRERGNRIRAIHRYLGKEICETHSHFSEESIQTLARIAEDARYRYRSSAKMRLQHLELAAKTLTPAGLTRYVRLFRADKPIQRLIRQLRPEEGIVEEPPSRANILKLLKKMPQRARFYKLRSLADGMRGESKETRDNFDMWALTQLDEVWRPEFALLPEKRPCQDQKMEQLKLMSRPLAEVPFSTTERRLVEGLLSLLMRTSESVARRPWPQKELWLYGQSHAERVDRDTINQVRGIRLKMERDEGILNELRGRIELGWLDHNKTRQTKRLSTSDLIDKVRALDEKVLGMPLLPSKACILHIIDIVNKRYPMETGPLASDNYSMPAGILKKFEEHLRMRDVYDEWRATNPPASELFWDTAVESIKRKYQTSSDAQSSTQ
jgi:hypothetical protein